MAALSSADPTSFSNPDEVVVSHIDLNLEVDFNKHILHGKVDLKLKKIKDGVDHLALDIRDIKIQNVLDKSTSKQLKFSIGDKVGSFGSKLDIQLSASQDKECEVTIEYETSPECSALQWLTPEQTAGKRQPYLFSQCQAIHCRSMIPCQDTPGVKCPYTAKITAPKDIKVLMSALLMGSEPCPGDSSKTVYSFKQDIPMPSYLIAIVGGDLVSKEIGPRSKVWTEKELIDKAAYEFSQTEHMLKTAEDLLGKYVWGHYDLLVLPPSFPYGGMENPCLTFVTPTLLAGDQSLADVVAHEITHSWTGNLITNKTFEDFWLNEGNTVFVERKIAARLHGGEPYRNFLAAGGWEILKETVKTLEGDNQAPYSRLVPDLKGVDPDEAFSSVPYEKGQAFLFYLEQLLGGPAVFEPFMRAYIDKFKYKSITTQDWKDFLMEYFQEQVSQGKLDSVDWDTWLNGEGMPPVKPQYDMSLCKVCDALANRWMSATEANMDQFVYSDIENFLPQQTMAFLTSVLNGDPLTHPKIKKMGDIYKFTEVQNSEIRFKWLRVCIKARYEDAISPALEFVTEQGRMKFVLPIYRDLGEWDTSRDQAIATFNRNRPQMHTTTSSKVAKILKLE